MLTHIDAVRLLSSKFESLVNAGLRDSDNTSVLAYKCMIVRALVSLFDVVDHFDIGFHAVRAMAELFRRSSHATMCFLFIKGPETLVSMFCRCCSDINTTKSSEEITHSELEKETKSAFLSPDGYINTSRAANELPQTQKSEPCGQIFGASQVKLRVAVVNLLAALCNKYFETCSCTTGDFFPETSDTLIPLGIDMSKLSDVELLCSFSGSNTAVHHCHLLLLMLLSGEPMLAKVAAEICANLLDVDPQNVILLDIAGCTTALFANVHFLTKSTPGLCLMTKHVPWLAECGLRCLTTSMDPLNIAEDLSILSDFGVAPSECKYSKEEMTAVLVFSLSTLHIISLLPVDNNKDPFICALLSTVHMGLTEQHYSPEFLKLLPTDCEYSSFNDQKCRAVLTLSGGLIATSSYDKATSGEDNEYYLHCQVCMQKAAAFECLSER